MSPRPATTAGFFLRRNGKRHRIFSGLTVDSTAAKRLRASTDSERKAGPATPLPPAPTAAQSRGSGAGGRGFFPAAGASASPQPPPEAVGLAVSQGRRLRPIVLKRQTAIALDASPVGADAAERDAVRQRLVRESELASRRDLEFRAEEARRAAALGSPGST